MTKWHDIDDIDGTYISPDLRDMYELNYKYRNAKNSKYSMLIALASLIVSIIALIINVKL